MRHFSLHDCFTVRNTQPTQEQPGYTPLRLTDYTHDVSATFAAEGYDGLWFSQETVWVSQGSLSIPFHVKTTSPQLMGTDLEEPGRLVFSVGQPVGTLYLLLGARFVGDEEVSLGRGPIKSVRHVERFVVEMTYENGITEQVFPRHVSTGEYCVGDRFGLYAVAAGDTAPVRTVALIDGMRQGAFYLAGATVSDQREEPAITVRYDAQPQSAVELPPVGESSVRVAGGSMVLENNHIKLTLSLANGLQMISLYNCATEAEYLQSPTPFLRVDDAESPGPAPRITDLTATLSEAYVTLRKGDLKLGLAAGFTGSGEVEFRLTVINESKQAHSLSIGFPELYHIGLAGPKFDIKQKPALWYAFPKRGAVISSAVTDLRADYGGAFPMQFIDCFWPGAGGFYIMTHDLQLFHKEYVLSKTAWETAMLGVGYGMYVPLSLAPGEMLELPPVVLGIHRGDWHDALKAYGEWLTTWYRPAVPHKDWFREVFNFRQQFLHFGWPEKTGMFQEPTKSFHFDQTLRDDQQAFGSVDYLHIYDWGWSPTSGRVGDYKPWDYLGGTDAFRSIIQKYQDSGLPVGLYLEGYLVSPHSQVAQEHAAQWQVLDQEGDPHTQFLPEIAICSAVPEWQEHLAAIYRQVWEHTGVKGMYIDELGFSDRSHFCFHPAHAHEKGAPPLRGDATLIRSIRQVLPDDVVLYTEESPADVISQYLDGSFTYAIVSTPDPLAPHHINLYRFVFPHFKTIEIIAVDEPLGGDYWNLKRIFFNGEAVWLMGTPHRWFTPETLAFIRRMNKVQRQYVRALTGLDCIPLYPTLVDDVYANRFTARGSSPTETLWTLYNNHSRTVRCEVLAVPHHEGVQYWDAWNDQPITPRLQDGLAIVSLEIDPKGVTALAQKLG